MEDIRRVFFHELGHFVANQINKLHLSGSGTEKILLYPCPQNPYVFCGKTSTFLPEGCNINSSPPMDRLAQGLLSCLYGCIFQAYERKESLKDCLDKNGCNDFDSLWKYLGDHNLSHNRGVFIELAEDYLEVMVKKRALEDFLRIDPETYLNKTVENNFIVNVEILERDTSDLVNKHVELYLEHISEIRKLINRTNT